MADPEFEEILGILATQMTLVLMFLRVEPPKTKDIHGFQVGKKYILHLSGFAIIT